MAGNRSILDVILGRRQPETSYSAFYFNNTSAVSTRSGKNVSSENVMQNATVLSCVNVISQGIAQLEWGVYQGTELQENHQLNNNLWNPNRFQTNFEFKYGIVRDLLTYGNTFVKVVRSSNGRVVELIPMDPQKMSVASNRFGVPVYNHDEYGEMSANEVIHCRDIAGHDIEGMSRVLLAAERVGALDAADRLIAETFKYGVSVNYSVEMDGSLDDTSREQLYKQLKQSFGQGGSRRGGIAVLEGGKMSAMKGSTPADADLRELRAQLINEIAALFRVPASLVGGSGDEKYNNVTARLSSMYRDTYQPLITNIEQAFSNNLTSGQNMVKFDVSDLLKGDLASQVTIATTALGGEAFMTKNEAREFIGLPRLEGEDMDEVPTQMAPEQVETDDRRGETPSDNGNVGDQPDG